MININQENLIPIRQLPKLLPFRPNGRPIHLSACYRWMDKGVNGAKLEAVRVGGTTYTSREALQRFAEDLSRPNRNSELKQHHHGTQPLLANGYAQKAKDIFEQKQPRTA